MRKRVGLNLKGFRQELGLSQEAFAFYHYVAFGHVLRVDLTQQIDDVLEATIVLGELCRDPEQRRRGRPHCQAGIAGLTGTVTVA